MSESRNRARVQDLARQLRDNLTDKFQERQARTEATVTSVTRDTAGRATAAVAIINGVAAQTVAIDHGARIAPGDTWLVRNTAAAALPRWEAERRLRAAAEVQAVDNLPTLPTPTGLAAITGLADYAAGAGWSTYIRAAWLGIGAAYGQMGYELQYCTNALNDLTTLTATDRQPTTPLDGAVTDVQTALPRDPDAAGYEDDFPSFGRIQIESEKIDYIAVTTGTGDSGTGTGAVNSLTDGTKTWTVDAWAGYMLTDSASAVFVVTANTATVLTVAGTPATGAYTIKPSFTGCTRAAGGTVAATHADNTGIGALSAGVSIATLPPGVDYNLRVRAKSAGGALSPWTAWVSITTAVDNVAPATPTGMGHTPMTVDHILLYWDAGTAPDIAYYEVSYYLESGTDPDDGRHWRSIVSEVELSWSRETAMYWRVRAVDVAGNASDYCAEQTAYGVPVAPIELLNPDFEDGDAAVDNWTLTGSGSLTVTWEATGGWLNSKCVKVVATDGAGADAWHTVLISDILEFQQSAESRPGFRIKAATNVNRISFTVFQYSDAGGTPAATPFVQHEISSSADLSDWQIPIGVGVRLYQIPVGSDATHVALAVEVHTLDLDDQTFYLDSAKFYGTVYSVDEGDHGSLTGLEDDDHLQYGLVVFSSTEPAGARAGTLWVVTS